MSYLPWLLGLNCYHYDSSIIKIEQIHIEWMTVNKNVRKRNFDKKYAQGNWYRLRVMTGTEKTALFLNLVVL